MGTDWEHGLEKQFIIVAEADPASAGPAQAAGPASIAWTEQAVAARVPEWSQPAGRSAGELARLAMAAAWAELAATAVGGQFDVPPPAAGPTASSTVCHLRTAAGSGPWNARVDATRLLAAAEKAAGRDTADAAD